MKKIKKIKVLILASVSMLMLGCDLELQERFVFEPEVDLSDPYGEITAWQFLNTPQANALNEDGGLIGDNFNYFKEAIQAAGMVDEYNTPNSGRTFLMLNNNAFLGGGDVIQLITGSADVEEGETPAEVMARADVDVLRIILNYHMVSTYITQLNPLIEFDINYEFQTMISGEDGRIVFRRDNRYRVDINRSPAPLPSSATSQFERVRNYNYVFNNGIGHSLNDPVRNQPYPRPN
jgi:hypothetical protein